MQILKMSEHTTGAERDEWVEWERSAGGFMVPSDMAETWIAALRMSYRENRYWTNLRNMRPMFRLAEDMGCRYSPVKLD